jgi:hypothetical protein
LGGPLLSSGIPTTALPHLTSFQNLQELDVGQVRHWDRIDINCTPIDVLTPIFSSFSATLKRLRWTQKNTGQDTWKSLYVLTNLLPNLTDLDLSGVDDCYLIFSPPAFPCLRLSHRTEPPDPFAFKHFKFRELKIVDLTPLSSPFLEYCKTHLRVLDPRPRSVGNTSLRPPPASAKRGLILTNLTDPNLEVLFKVCHALQEIHSSFYPYLGRFLGSVSSNSVTLIRLSFLDDTDPGLAMLGVSMRKISQRFSDHNRGLKTRVQVVHRLTEQEAQAIDSNGEIPFFMAKLEEELGTHATLEPKFLPYLIPEPDPDTE